MNPIITVGYSGHAFVVADAIYSIGGIVTGYCDQLEKEHNPFHLKYLGPESREILEGNNWIVGVGDNFLRERIIEGNKSFGTLVSVFHNSSIRGAMCEIRPGTFMAAHSVLNPLVKIGLGCIINTGAIVEHGCKIGNFTHIAPGTVLAGNVQVGNRSFIGANSVVKQGVSIGNDVIVGAGSVILRDVEDACVMVGNPAKKIR